MVLYGNPSNQFLGNSIRLDDMVATVNAQEHVGGIASDWGLDGAARLLVGTGPATTSESPSRGYAVIESAEQLETRIVSYIHMQYSNINYDVIINTFGDAAYHILTKLEREGRIEICLNQYGGSRVKYHSVPCVHMEEEPSPTYPVQSGHTHARMYTSDTFTPITNMTWYSTQSTAAWSGNIYTSTTTGTTNY